MNQLISSYSRDADDEDEDDVIKRRDKRIGDERGGERGFLYSPSIVSICELFSIEKCRRLSTYTRRGWGLREVCGLLSDDRKASVFFFRFFFLFIFLFVMDCYCTRVKNSG